MQTLLGGGQELGAQACGDVEALLPWQGALWRLRTRNRKPNIRLERSLSLCPASIWGWGQAPSHQGTSLQLPHLCYLSMLYILLPLHSVPIVLPGCPSVNPWVMNI